MNIQIVTMKDIWERDKRKSDKKTYVKIKDLESGKIYNNLKDCMKELKISRTLFYYYLDKKTGRSFFKGKKLEVVTA